MFLSQEKIKEAVRSGDLSITPFDGQNLKLASYTFTLDNIFVIPETTEEITVSEEGYALSPGSFVLGRTKEILNLKNKYVCILSTRGSIAKQGIDALQSSIIAEPDTNNHLTLEISNRSTKEVILFPNTQIVKGLFSPI